MRVIVFFDLPVTSVRERNEYIRFRKFLIKSGFVMIQQSVYSKIVLNNTVGDAVKESVRRNKTKNGSIQMLTVTEKQFAAMEYIVGERSAETLDSDERFVLI